MKWRSKEGRQIDERARNKQGDIKSVWRFALFPTKLSNKDVVWLGLYKVEYFWSKSWSRWFLQEKG